MAPISASAFWTRWRLISPGSRPAARSGVSVGIGEVEEISVYIRGQARAAAAFIDIGINQVTDADGNSRIVGDADTGVVADIAGWTMPVPGSVGSGTVAIPMRNAAIALEKQIQLGWV